MKKIVIDAELRSLIPPLRPDELEGLGASLQSEGCRDPLVIWGSKGILLDGHNRFDICKANGWSYTIVELEFDGRDEAKLWTEQNQLNRRNLTDDQRAAIAYRIGERRAAIEKRERARKGRERGGKCSPEQAKDRLENNVTSKRSSEPKGRTRTIAAAEPKPKERTRTAVARQANVPARKVQELSTARSTIRKVVGETAAEKLVNEVASGDKSVKEAKAEARRAKRDAAQRDEIRAATEAVAAIAERGESPWEVRQGDCLVALSEFGDQAGVFDGAGLEVHGPARLIFADPPYNIDVDYGPHYHDGREADEFQRWCARWIGTCHRALALDGSLFVLTSHEWAWVLCYEAVETVGFHLRQWITWYETFGVNCTGKYNRCSRALLWLTKDERQFCWNPDAVNRPSDRQAKYNDRRANPDGKVWDDVWGVNPPIPRLVGNAKERISGFPTQLPLDLLRPIVGCHSDPGDLVIDPFSGSGTTGAACIALGRRFLGVELSPEFADLSRKRLSGCTRKAKS